MDDFDLLARPAHRRDAPVSRPAADAHPISSLQRTAGNAAVAAELQREEGAGGGRRSPVLDVIGRGGGRALDAGVRSEMEGALGADFSDVRVHDDSTAASSAAAVGAHAYTTGHEIVFGQGAYSPATTDGKRTLAHELTHVIQQRSGPVDGTSSGDGVAVSDPGDRFEREASAHAEHVVNTGAAPGVQREETHHEGDGHDHSVQGIAIQREGEEEEEVQAIALQREDAPEASEEEEQPA